MKRLICIATLLAWSSALAADGYLAISNNVMVTGPGGSGADPNALTNNDTRAITLTNAANVFAGASFTVATQYVGTVVLTNVDGSFWTNLTSTNINNSGGSAGQVLTATATGVGWSNSAAGNAPTFNANQFSSDASGTNIPAGATFTNILLTGSTNYGSTARTNWTWMDAAGWHNTNNSAASQGVDISKGKIITPNMMTPTNTPTDAYVLTATGTAGDTAWKVASGSAVGYQLLDGFIGTTTLNVDTNTRYIQPNGQVSSTTETVVSCPSGNRTFTLTNWYIKLNSSAPAIGTNVTYTVMTNGSASNFAVTFVGGAGSIYSNTVDSVTIPVNSTWSIRVVGNNPSVFTSNHRWNFGLIIQ